MTEKKKGKWRGPPEYQGYLATPEGKAKAQAGYQKYLQKKRDHKERMESALDSAMADNDATEVILTSLVEIAKDVNHPEFKWAIEMLTKMNALKFAQPVEKKEDEKKEDMSAEDAASILRRYSSKGKEE